VRADVIVIVPPEGQDFARVRQAFERGLVQALVAQASVEALGEGVLLRLAGVDIMPGDPRAGLPFEERAAGEFRAVVTDHAGGLAVHADHSVEFARDAMAANRGVGDHADAFPRAIVDHRKYAQAPRWSERVGDEVDAPARVRGNRNRHRIARAQGALTTTALAHREAFFGVETEELLRIHLDAFAFEHEADPAIAEPSPLLGDRFHPRPDVRVIAGVGLADRLGINADERACASLREAMDGDGFHRRRLLRRRRD